MQSSRKKENGRKLRWCIYSFAIVIFLSLLFFVRLVLRFLRICAVFHLRPAFRAVSLGGWHPGLTCCAEHLFESNTHVMHPLMSSESDGAPSCRQRGGAGGKLSVPSQANNNKPGAGFQWAFSLKWDTATRITNISLVLSSGPGPWKNYSKYLPRFIWNPGIG